MCVVGGGGCGSGTGWGGGGVGDVGYGGQVPFQYINIMSLFGDRCFFRSEARFLWVTMPQKMPKKKSKWQGPVV